MEILSKPVSDIQKIIDMYKRLPSFRSHVEVLEDLVNLALVYGNTLFNLEYIDEKVILNSVLMYMNIDSMQFMSICNVVKEKYPSAKLKKIKLTEVGWI